MVSNIRQNLPPPPPLPPSPSLMLARNAASARAASNDRAASTDSPCSTPTIIACPSPPSCPADRPPLDARLPPPRSGASENAEEQSRGTNARHVEGRHVSREMSI